MIGIGITTHNRPDEADQTLDAISKFLPDDVVIVVVDDASDTPYPYATFRFDENVGICRAKNKCLELLLDAGCDDLFLFDDDTRPKVDGWWKPYVDSPEPHLMYIFTKWADGTVIHDTREIYRDSHIMATTHPRGCMLYLHKSVTEVIGGFNTAYRRWGYEHVDLSNRIFNAGLTSFRFADVINSQDLIYSGDEHKAVTSTVPNQERSAYLREMKQTFDASFKSKQYCEFREKPRRERTGKNVVLASYTVGTPDPQRGQWTPDIHQLDTLSNSIDVAENSGARIVVLTDCFGNHPESGFVSVECALNPYFQRWLNHYQYLRDNPDIDMVWCVDATDVEMMRDPFPEMDERKLYVGDEPSTLNNPWMLDFRNHGNVVQWLRQNSNLPLLNAGILGGTRENVMAFCHEMVRVYFDNFERVGVMDMGTFNHVAYSDKFKDIVEHGPQVNTRFKSFDHANSTNSWWRHK